MTFVEDIVNGFDGRNQWPQGVADELGVELIADEFIDSGRWYNYRRAIFKRRNVDNGIFDFEYAGVEYHEPATELQDWDDFDGPEVYEVEPVVVTTTRYVKKD